mmetsp:Transcript_15021/g.57001  ORF Transcript_15021/g.57001 Transcript_15021/m.57001 type:complete len:323 (+) Transcript_15021:118-1086(+)
MICGVFRVQVRILRLRPETKLASCALHDLRQRLDVELVEARRFGVVPPPHILLPRILGLLQLVQRLLVHKESPFMVVLLHESLLALVPSARVVSRQLSQRAVLTHDLVVGHLPPPLSLPSFFRPSLPLLLVAHQPPQLTHLPLLVLHFVIVHIHVVRHAGLAVVVGDIRLMSRLCFSLHFQRDQSSSFPSPLFLPCAFQFELHFFVPLFLLLRSFELSLVLRNELWTQHRKAPSHKIQVVIVVVVVVLLLGAACGALRGILVFRCLVVLLQRLLLLPRLLLLLELYPRGNWLRNRRLQGQLRRHLGAELATGEVRWPLGLDG